MSKYASSVLQSCIVVMLPAIISCRAPQKIDVSKETLDQAKKVGFEYESVLERAQSGEQYALTQLLWFSMDTDAAGSIGHGVVLIELLEQIGDAAFAEVARHHRSRVRLCVATVLEAGMSYTKEPKQAPFDELYPETFLALGVVTYFEPTSRIASPASTQPRY